MSFNVATKDGRKAAEAEIETRLKAFPDAKARSKYLRGNGWVWLRAEEKENNGKKFFVVFWKQPGTGREVRQTQAIRQQLESDMVMAGEIVRNTGAR